MSMVAEAYGIEASFYVIGVAFLGITAVLAMVFRGLSRQNSLSI
jgi:hypothetical protein